MPISRACGRQCATARPELLAAAVGLTLITYVVRTERWQYLLEPLGKTRFQVAFRATVIGFAASSVLPARAGEVLRPYLLARREGLSATATFATIIVERILDLVAVLVLLATYLIVFDTGMAARDSALFAAIRLGGLVMAPVAVVSLVVMFVLAGHPEWLRAWLSAAERILPARLSSLLSRLTRMFSEGFGVLRRPERLLASMGWTVGAVGGHLHGDMGGRARVRHRHAVRGVVADARTPRGRRGRAHARRRGWLSRGVSPRRHRVLRRRTTMPRSGRRFCCTRRRSCR